MTSNSPLTRALINPSAPAAAVQLFMRQSVTALSQTAFLRPRQLFWEAMGTSGSCSWLAHLAETLPA
jgi:hypothetical protein